jgi:hypothetical protein
MHSVATAYGKRFVAGARIALGGVAVHPVLPGKEQAMEMAEYGKPMMPASHPSHTLWNPSGFPHFHDVDDEICVSSYLSTRIIATARGW